MRLMRTARFKRAYQKLSEQGQERVKKALRLLLAYRPPAWGSGLQGVIPASKSSASRLRLISGSCV